MSESRDTSRSAVKTYVPAYQKGEWEEHAERLDMSLSEFVRTMVQAGRRGFEPDRGEPHPGDATPGGHALEEEVLELLSGGPLPWEELLEAATDDVESRLDETLTELQATDRIRYSGRHGGYVLVGGEDGH